jgi:hypothetical protein
VTATGISAHSTGSQLVNPDGGDGHVTGALLKKGAEDQIARPIVTLFEGRRLNCKPDGHHVEIDLDLAGRCRARSAHGAAAAMRRR